MSNNPTAIKELVITRIFNAPRELVFQMWTDPKHVAQWWGPQYFTNPVCEMDVRPGGAIHIEMTAPDGTPSPVRGTFHEIVPPERLVFTTTAFEDEHGNFGLEGLNTITLEDYNGKTRLTLKAVIVKAVPEVADALAGMDQGWNESLDKLAETIEALNGGREMTDNSNNSSAYQVQTPKPGLKQLDRLVGTWELSGPNVMGQVRFEWMEGGFFLMQHVDMVNDGHKIKGIEIIGYERGWEAMMNPAGNDNAEQDITSHWFDNEGNTFTYTWEIEDDTLTIWGGQKGSPSFYRGKFSKDGNTNSGGWQWPGGGYDSTMTRVK